MVKSKGYDFIVAEEKILSYWSENKTYKFVGKKGAYSIDTPPPTVSGKMHIGHAFSYSQQDFIARFRRMYHSKEGGVFYPFGTDDNGLPTEKLIEKIKNVKSKDMSREDFIDLCLKTLKEITPDFVKDWKRLGVSCDYDVYYSTIDDTTRKLSQKYFIELFKKGEVYRKNFPTIWDTRFQTPVAQAELEDKEVSSFFTTLKFTVDGNELPIATTRPELLGACVAVFVNPKDKRYKSFVGKKAKVPLFENEVPILEDESAEIDKGTGVLMICSYGDKFDVDAIQRHKLDSRVVLNYDGTLNDLSGKYSGLKTKEARKEILKDLKDAGLVLAQKEITHVVNVFEKSGEEIEFLPTQQWFIKLLDKRKKLISQAKKINWFPEFMFKRYENWVNGLDWDWSVSRDRHFGIPIPIWECESCKEFILPSEKELPVDPSVLKKKCPKCKNESKPEMKVLDTWVTSSITPQIASSLVGGKIKVPFSLRPNAHDIIRTWAFYTIVRSFIHENEIPWKDIGVSGIVSLKGEKMSKSKGNVIDPQEVISQYGADSLRFWAAGSKLGEDLDYQEKDLVAGKKLINKLTNASKFVFMNLEDYDFKKPKKLEKIDELFLFRLNEVVKKSTDAFLKHEYSKSKQETDNFFWSDFCDNYLEIVKKRVYQGSGDSKVSAQYTLYQSLLTILKLFAPFVPFVTEEIYQEYFKKKEKVESVHLMEWPKFEKVSDYNNLNLLFDLISKVRQEKSKNQKPMNSEIVLALESLKNFEGMEEDLRNVVNAKEIKEGKFKVEFI